SMKFEVGVHPGYDSVEKEELKSEIKILANITGKEIISGRQHFLKFRLPETYESLYAAGIRKEYSMGYSDETGFRAGIAFPFNWFNLEKEIETDLEIIPFCIMDVALQHFQNLNPEEAIQHSLEIKKAVNDCNGFFSFVFHNESLSETNQWVGWRPVFEFLLSE
ncbi:MAG: polysaccharide deacetylase family protein, partial [Bacteroidia bacterium]|nr:polysaccharide deacetylase family protein [Bacteroidia bacterium]